MTEEEVILAGELALGVLDGEERAAALRQVIADPAFAREVEQWRSRFAVLHGEWPDVDPGSSVEERISRVGWPTRGVSGAWRWMAVASSAAAAVLLILLAQRQTPAPMPVSVERNSAPSLIAVIKPTEGDPFGALIDLDRRIVRLSGAITIPVGKQAELWAIGSDGVPHAAALLTSRASSTPLRRNVAVKAGTTLAISIEPAGGSPKPAPTGPVVATGKLATV